MTHTTAGLSRRFSTTLAVGASMTALACASPSLGQSAPPAAATDVPPGLGDIVVTAQKRKSTVQKTPIAITVIGRTELQRQDVHDLNSLARIAPDVNFRQGAGLPVITIRGISSNDTSEVGDPAVAVAIDGVVNNRPYALNASLYDLDRVEVLRGPQGTLSGRSAVGGAINFITAQPEKTDKGYVSLQLGNYKTIDAEAMANLALNDKVQLRVAGVTRYNGGYRTIAPFGRADDDVNQSIRATLAVQPTERLSTSLSVQYTHLGGVGQAQQYLPLVRNASGGIVHERPAIPSYRDFYAGAQPDLNAADIAVRGRADYNLGAATITYIGGYEKINYRQTYFSALAATSTFNIHEQPETVNQELRIASNGEGRLTWLLGGYFFNEDNSVYTFTRRPSRVTAFQVRGNTYAYGTRARSLAGFGSISYRVLDGLKLTGGVRYAHDTKRRDGFTYTANIGVNPVTYTPVSAAGDGSYSKFTYDAKVEWQAAPANLLYAKFDTGYKPGGFTNVNTYGPETVQAFEIGSKNRFFDGKVQFNIAAFYEQYRNQQLSQNVTVGDRIFVAILNAGRSTIYGIEPELSAEVPVLGRVDLSVQYLHARLKDFVNLGVQYAGNQLPQAPELSLSAGFSRDFATAHGTFGVETRTKVQTKSYLDYTNYGEQRQGSYSSTNVNISYMPPSGAWRLELYGRNLEDRQILQEAAVNSFANAYRFSYGAPRTYGVKLSAWF